jgi:altronate hydrolase
VQIYRRANGDVGVRNELWILPTVGCVNAMARQMQNRFLKETNDAEGIDGVHLFSHTYGCSQLGDDHINTRTMLQNMVRHPNAGAVLVVGLGCENNRVDAFRETWASSILSAFTLWSASTRKMKWKRGLNIFTSCTT